MPSWFSRFWFPNLFLLLSFGLLVGWSPLSGASANPSSIPMSVSGSQVRYNADFGAMRITAEATGMTYEFIALGGTVVDTYSQVGGCPSP